MDQPQLLSCAHTYCTGCLKTLVVEHLDADQPPNAKDTNMAQIWCPECYKYSLVELHLDDEVVNKSVSDDGHIPCTSFKEQENIWAKYSDDEDLRYPGHITEHQPQECIRSIKVIIRVISINLLSQFYCATLKHTKILFIR